jgi:hypothetical protein
VRFLRPVVLIVLGLMRLMLVSAFMYLIVV